MAACISKRVNLVLRFFDDYDLKAIENEISIYLNGYNFKPIRKAGGYFIFTNLESHVYEIKIQSELYFSEFFNVNLKDLDSLNPVINIRLKLRPKYFLKEDGLIIKFKVFDNEIPVNNGQINAVLYTKDYFVGQVMEEKVDISHKNILIDEFYEEFFSGDILYIESSRKAKDEFITIHNKISKSSYEINECIKNKHKCGEKLRKAIITRTDNDGSGIIYFKNLLTNKNKIKITITSNEKFKEVVIETEETLVNLGKVSI